MNEHKVKTFNIPSDCKLSKKAIDIHLSLYGGYVKNLNDHYKAMADCSGDNAKLTAPALNRRIGFELAGVLNHELYFEALENGPDTLTSGSMLEEHISKTFKDLDGLKMALKNTALLMRGIGWVLLVFDKENSQFHILWVSDHELGNVNLPAVVAVDMWEHAYMVDYEPKDKGSYVDVYLDSINWKNIEKRFDSLV